MAAVRWFLDWVAPLILMAFGICWFLSSVFWRPREQASLVIDEPWWITALVSGVLFLLGALRMRLTLRMRQHRV